MEKVNVLDTRAQIFKLGSIYLDGFAAYPGFGCSSGNFTIGDTVAGMELRWIQMGNALVADRCACVGISWETLNSMGYIFGRSISIDGRPYLCRSLKVGAESKTAFSEWDKLLKIESANAIIHWKNIYSWGQETPKGHLKRRAARGFFTAHYWDHHDTMDQALDLGFRPVLEPLISNLANITVGSNIKVYGSHGQAIEGVLTSINDYDLTMIAAASDINLSGWAVQCGEEILVSRSSILGIGEVAV